MHRIKEHLERVVWRTRSCTTTSRHWKPLIEALFLFRPFYSNALDRSFQPKRERESGLFLLQGEFIFAAVIISKGVIIIYLIYSIRLKNNNKQKWLFFGGRFDQRNEMTQSDWRKRFYSPFIFLWIGDAKLSYPFYLSLNDLNGVRLDSKAIKTSHLNIAFKNSCWREFWTPDRRKECFFLLLKTKTIECLSNGRDKK